MDIYEITNKKFQQYGSVIKGYDFTQLVEEMKLKKISQNLEYVASDLQLERLPILQEIKNGFYGGMPIQLGYCMGYNQKLNALEYHRSSEINVAATDYMVWVGKLQDVNENFMYDTAFLEAFYVPEGAAVEFYATTLHYCACHINKSGYSHATFLPLGTNCKLIHKKVVRTEEDKLLFAKNKWILAHEESAFVKELPVKLKGENISIDFINLKERKQ